LFKASYGNNNEVSDIKFQMRGDTFGADF